MIYNVSQLMREPSGSCRTHQVDQRHALTDDAPVGRVRGTVNLLRTDKGIWVSATLDSEVQSACSRCLNEYVQPINMSIEEESFPLEESATVANPPGENDGNLNIDEHHILDISDTVREYSALAVPMKPVCREECAGICTSCGVNLNETTCECDKTPRVHRWDALLEFAQSRDKES